LTAIHSVHAALAVVQGVAGVWPSAVRAAGHIVAKPKSKATTAVRKRRFAVAGVRVEGKYRYFARPM
jgi:hypothetical protein